LCARYAPRCSPPAVCRRACPMRSGLFGCSMDPYSARPIDDWSEAACLRTAQKSKLPRLKDLEAEDLLALRWPIMMLFVHAIRPPQKAEQGTFIFSSKRVQQQNAGLFSSPLFFLASMKFIWYRSHPTHLNTTVSSAESLKSRVSRIPRDAQG